MRGLMYAFSFALAACQPVPVVSQSAHQASEFSCGLLYDDFSTNVDLAIAARRDGEQGEAVYRMMAADMNLDVLLARDCCRFERSCPAAVSF